MVLRLTERMGNYLKHRVIAAIAFITSFQENNISMYQYKRSYITSEMKVSEIIKENPSILLILEHFGINDILHDKNVSQLCRQHGLEENLLISICNLYNGFNASDELNLRVSSIPSILRFLNNSHSYYLNEKYPEIIGYIKQLGTIVNVREIKLVELFFTEYFNEVREHLNYEETTVFPYFYGIIENRKTRKKNFSASTYLHHHSDIETKLEDLKNLLLEHLLIKDKPDIKRKLLFSLFELEFDLKVHSLIEEKILIPLALLLEQDKK